MRRTGAIGHDSLPMVTPLVGRGEHAAAQPSLCETAAQEVVRRHRERDKREPDQDGTDRDQRVRTQLEASAGKLHNWLSKHADVVGKRGYVKTQNITDPDSAKMMTSHGVRQGYTGVAAVDERHQVIVYAEAFW